MRKSMQLLGCLAILAAPMIAFPAYAQTGGTTPPAAAPSDAQHAQWRADHEQMEQLQAEHDRLKSQCLDAKGQDRTDCDQKMKALHDKKKALHEKMMANHEQHKGQHQAWKAKHDQNQNGTAPSGPIENPPKAPSQQ